MRTMATLKSIEAKPELFAKYFPELSGTFFADGTPTIKISTIHKERGKSIRGIHVTACVVERKDGFVSTKMSPLGTPCLRAMFDSSYLPKKIDLAVKHAKEIFEGQIRVKGLPEDHPYVTAIASL